VVARATLDAGTIATARRILEAPKRTVNGFADILGDARSTLDRARERLSKVADPRPAPAAG